jgi:hypothetical protein
VRMQVEASDGLCQLVDSHGMAPRPVPCALMRQTHKAFLSVDTLDAQARATAEAKMPRRSIQAREGDAVTKRCRKKLQSAVRGERRPGPGGRLKVIVAAK